MSLNFLSDQCVPADFAGIVLHNHLAAFLTGNPKAFREFMRMFVPEGHDENSPAFQRREPVGRDASPEGTVENPIPFAFQPSLRDSNPTGLNPALKTLGYCRLSRRDSRNPTRTDFPKGITANPEQDYYRGKLFIVEPHRIRIRE